MAASALLCLADLLLERPSVRGEDYFVTLLLAEARPILWKLSAPRPSFAAEYPRLHLPDGGD